MSDKDCGPKQTEKCEACKGEGGHNNNPSGWYWIDCHKCHGTGRDCSPTDTEKCATCNGTQRVKPFALAYEAGVPCPDCRFIVAKVGGAAFDMIPDGEVSL